MRFKSPQIEIPQDDPFRYDTLGRKQYAEFLTQFLDTVGEPLVISLDAPWGMGKTTFLKMWMRHLENLSYTISYFNAWENDHSDDPLVSLIGELEITFKHQDIPAGERRGITTQLSDIKKAGAILVRRAVPLAFKILTRGALDLEEEAEKEVAGTIEKLAEDALDKYEEDKNKISTFKEKLSTLANSVLPSNEGLRKPVVFIIDELDRCRPTYSVELLERVKHAFNVEGIIFIIAVDKEQIGHSVKTLYGDDMDSTEYLRRFFDYDYRLPEPSMIEFCRNLWGRFGFPEYFSARQARFGQEEQSDLIKLSSDLAFAQGLSLRATEQYFSSLSIVFRTTPIDGNLYPWLIAPLVILKTVNSEVFDQFASRQTSIENVMSILKSGRENRGLDSSTNERIEKYLVLSISNKRQIQSELENIRNNLNPNELRGNPSARRAEVLMQHLQKFNQYGISEGPLDIIVKRIRLASNFNS